MCELA